jgi:pseudouridylate synthase / pseudouridine kinase
MPPFTLAISPEVRAALSSGRPVVALESSIICHGMDWPTNLSTARACEAAVRANGATPATCAVLDGVPVVGCADAQIERLAKMARDGAGAARLRKVARRDLAKCVHDAACGGTTVSATMTLAHMAGIRVFATGGIGGVHRGVAETFDISADIAALAATPILVVSAGVKTLLDVGKTLEALESASVNVMALCPDGGEFPGFYTRQSGFPAPAAVDDELTAARVAAVSLHLGGPGTLLAVPVPKRHEADAGVISAALQTALAEQEERGIAGRDATPFLLGRIATLTRDHSLACNVELVKNNAAVAARIARHLCAPDDTDVDVLVAGACAVDVTAAVAAGRVLRGTSNPGSISLTVGGVGCNVAEAARAAGARVLLLSAVGDDALGAFALTQLVRSGMGQGVDVVRDARTATYCAVNARDGNLDTAVADMSIFSESFAPDAPRLAAALRSAKILCVDANLSAARIGALVRLAQQRSVPVWYEPVSVAKCVKILPDVLAGVSYISPNADELAAMWRALAGGSARTAPDVDTMARDLIAAHRRLGGGALCILCTLGAKGVALYRSSDTDHRGQTVPAAPVPGGVVVSTSGAGDVFAGTMLANIAVRGATVAQAAADAVVKAAACCAVRGTAVRARL